MKGLANRLRNGRSVLVLLFACFIVWVFSAPIAADLLVVDRSIERADAIVVLSGAADYRQRAAGAAAAYRSGVAGRVIITDDGQRGGWDDTEKGNPYFVERMRRELVRLGVGEEAIETLPGKVGSTEDEAEKVVAAAAARHYGALLLVTSDYHSRRAHWVFDRKARQVGPALAVGLIRAPSDERYPGRYTWWLSRRGWRTVGAEYLKFAFYWFYY